MDYKYDIDVCKINLENSVDWINKTYDKKPEIDKSECKYRLWETEYELHQIRRDRYIRELELLQKIRSQKVGLALSIAIVLLLIYLSYFGQ